MTERILGPTGARRKRLWLIGPLATLVVFVGLFVSSGAVALPAATCLTLNHLTGSAFEIDVNANLRVDGLAADCIDWDNSGPPNDVKRSGVLSKPDKPAGSGDDSFGQGTAEDEANPTIVDGSIPPNKSDLKTFGVYTETTGAAQFLELFWSRVQNPSGTTNMDFELNQEFCDGTATHCANNAPANKPAVYVTPKRMAGDKLITYDLSKGGTVPTISIRTWSGSAWGSPTVISGPSGSAIGAVNSSAIASADSFIGAQDAFTFGEVALSYSAIFPGGTSGCGTFGSAYLKSRSSDSFPAELKDFIAPEPVQITNCSTLTTSATASVTIGSPISDNAILAGVPTSAGGTITFHLFNNATCTTEVTTGLSPVAVSGSGTYNSGNFTPTAVGTYYWTAVYSGDPNNAGSSTACGDANESSVVSKKQPSISTSATASVTIGSPISDTATLSGGTTDISGTITFTLYGPSDTAVCTTAIFTTTKTVAGNGPYTSATFTPTAVGTYYWIASYGGDPKNLSASTACGDSGESSIVGKRASSMNTSPFIFPNDSVTVTDGDTPTGNVAFSLYDTLTNCNAGGTTGRLFTETVALSSGSASTHNGNPSDSIADYPTSASTTVFWRVSYEGDLTHFGRNSFCVEKTAVTETGDTGGTAP